MVEHRKRPREEKHLSMQEVVRAAARELKRQGYSERSILDCMLDSVDLSSSAGLEQARHLRDIARAMRDDEESEDEG